jgi:uncharacterized protein (DUF1919 family)
MQELTKQDKTSQSLYSKSNLMFVKIKIKHQSSLQSFKNRLQIRKSRIEATFSTSNQTKSISVNPKWWNKSFAAQLLLCPPKKNLIKL